MKDKMYIINFPVMFVSANPENELLREAWSYLKESIMQVKSDAYSKCALIKEVSSLEDVPEIWNDLYLWGEYDALTPASFLNRKQDIENKEYKEYLRLKEKFEGR